MCGQAQARALSNGANTPNMAMQDMEDMQVQDKTENATEPPGNELIDFDTF